MSFYSKMSDTRRTETKGNKDGTLVYQLHLLCLIQVLGEEYWARCFPLTWLETSHVVGMFVGLVKPVRKGKQRIVKQGVYCMKQAAFHVTL